MKALLRDKQVFWPHFSKGMLIIFMGGIIWFVDKDIGYGIILYGSIMWSLLEILLGGDEQTNV